jgi:hypothetical protein
MPNRRRDRYGAAANRTEAPRTQAPAPVRTDPIRVTLDLSPRQHRELKAWCNAVAVEAGLPQVALAPVLRILGEVLASEDPDDPDLTDALRAVVKHELEKAAQDAALGRPRRH